MSLAIVAAVLIPAFGTQVLPADMRLQLFTTLEGLDWTTVGLGAAIVLVLLDLLLMAAAMTRFQRARLILD